MMLYVRENQRELNPDDTIYYLYHGTLCIQKQRRFTNILRICAYKIQVLNIQTKQNIPRQIKAIIQILITKSIHHDFNCSIFEFLLLQLPQCFFDFIFYLRNKIFMITINFGNFYIDFIRLYYCVIAATFYFRKLKITFSSIKYLVNIWSLDYQEIFSASDSDIQTYKFLLVW